MATWASPKHLKPHSTINYWAPTSTSTNVFSLPPPCTLNLRYNDIGDEGATALAAVLPDSSITNLDLGFNHIRDVGAIALAAVLPSSIISIKFCAERVWVWSLCLANGKFGNWVGVEGEAAMAKALRLALRNRQSMCWVWPCECGAPQHGSGRDK